MRGEASRCRGLLAAGGGRWGGEERALMEDTLDGLTERLELLDSTLEQQCDGMRGRLQDHSAFQVRRALGGHLSGPGLVQRNGSLLL